MLKCPRGRPVKMTGIGFGACVRRAFGASPV